MTQLILQEKIGPVTRLILNRPQRHNSLVPPFLEALLAALASVRQDDTTRAVLLQANGRSFSTGGDVGGFYEHLDDIESYSLEVVGLLNQVILEMVNLPVPVVAAVHGIVTGGSIGLVLAADEVLVTPETSFTPYYSVVGFSPDGGWSVMLPHIIGPKRTSGILMHNRTITAEQAVAWGIACRMAPATAIRQEALQAAEDLVTKKQGSLGHIKQLATSQYGDLAAKLDSERTHFVRQIVSKEARQGIVRFLGKSGEVN